MSIFNLQIFGGRGASSSSGGGGGGAFTWMSDTEAQQLRDDMDGNYEPDVVNAIKMYISSADANGDGFSYSQNLNYKLDNDLPLDVNEAYIDSFIGQGMHNIGKNTQLFRACHDDVLKRCGISEYGNARGNIQKSAVIRGKLNSNAKVISYSKATSGLQQEIASGSKLGRSLSRMDNKSAVSMYALSKGYNVISSGHGYLNILNRNAVTMSKTTKAVSDKW